MLCSFPNGRDFLLFIAQHTHIGSALLDLEGNSTLFAGVSVVISLIARSAKLQVNQAALLQSEAREARRGLWRDPEPLLDADCSRIAGRIVVSHQKESNPEYSAPASLIDPHDRPAGNRSACGIRCDRVSDNQPSKEEVATILIQRAKASK
jgi:hypothetical protein